MSDSYYASMNAKIQAQKQVNSMKNKVQKIDDKITNKLLFHYDQTFDKNYDHIQKLNKNIMTRNSIININNNDYNYKVDVVFVLRNFLYLLLFILLIFLGATIGIYSRNTMNTILIISMVLFVVGMVYYFKESVFGTVYMQEIKNEGLDELRQGAKDLLPYYITKDRCPKDCRPKKLKYKRGKPKIVNTPGEMKTDSTANVWLYGDQVEATGDLPYSTKNDPSDPYIPTFRQGYSVYTNKPQPWYGGVDDIAATIYKCKWDGSGANVTDVEKANYDINELPKEFNSYVPCKYYPGYKEVGKQIGKE